MYKHRAIPVLVNALEINNEFGGIMFCIRHNLCPEQGDDMVRDDLTRFVLKIGVVDAEV